MKKSKFIICIVFLSMITTLYIFSDSFSEGESFFKKNEPLKAIEFLEQSVQENPQNIQALNLLGLSYYQTGDYEKALSTFLKGTEIPSDIRYVFYYNSGNCAFAMADYSSAEVYFTSCYTLNPNFSKSILNRANTRVKLDLLSDARDDYKLYLSMEENTPQRAEIEKLISLLNQEWYERQKTQITYEQEQEKLETEIERLLLQRENEKLEQELKLKKEAERRKKLLEEIAASLDEGDATNLSVGSEGVIEYEQESELD